MLSVSGKEWHLKSTCVFINNSWFQYCVLSDNLVEHVLLSTSSLQASTPRRSSGGNRTSSIASLGFGGRKKTRKGSGSVSSEPTLEHR